MTSLTDHSSQTREQTYTANGQVDTVNVNGQVVATYTYTNGHLTQRTDAAGNAATFEYNTAGQLARQLDPENRAQRYDYDAQGRLWKTIDGNSNEIVREYGPVATTGGAGCPSCGGNPLLGGAGVGERLLKITYPTFTKAFQYDAEGRVSAEIYTLGTDAPQRVSTAYTYDAFGRLKTTTGPDNQTTTYTYDRLGRRVQVDDPSGSTRFEYDRWDHLTALIDAKSQRTAFEYYPDGKLKKEIRPLLQATQYEYDDLGRVWKILDANGKTTQYGYAQGRLNTITYAGGKTVTLSYDPNGNLSGYTDGATSAAYTHDALGRKLTETVNYGPFSKSFSYTYYKNGLKQTFTAPDNSVFTYNYGNNNELKEVQMPGVGSISLPEYTWNRPKTITFPGGTQRAVTYDALMRLHAVTVTDPGGTPLLNATDTYDAAGNLRLKTTEHGAYGYGYDAASRLISADNPTLPYERYAYDAVGNRQTASGVTGTITHNANNELLAYGDTAYTYDANGNLTQKKVGAAAVNYIYNAENRLVKVEDDLTKVVMAEYGYDPFGRRLWKEVNGVRTYFCYSEEGLIAEYDANGNELRSYGYQPDSTWTTDPLFLKQNGQYYFYQNDHLGTPQKLVAQNGAVVWSASYEAFGQAQVETETVVNNLRFPGQYYDAETGWHYNYQRYYEPRSGRYIQVDPIGLKGGDANLYNYVNNTSLVRIDPFGLTSIDNIGTGELQYSCKCSWLDWTHIYLSDGVKKLWAQIQSNKGLGFSRTCKGFKVYYYIMAKQWGVPAYWSEGWLRHSYFVKKNLTPQEQESVALAIYQKEAFSVEEDQLLAVFGYIDPWVVHSGFSEEDLVSDLMGFYIGIGKETEASIKEHCDALDFSPSLWVWWKAYGWHNPHGIGESKNYSWYPKGLDDSSYNYNCYTHGRCSSHIEWPKEIFSIKPAPEGKLWREWEPWTDEYPSGELGCCPE